MAIRGLGTRQLVHALESGGATAAPKASGTADGGLGILAERILLLVGWGIISPNCAQWLAAGGVENGFKDESLEKLANVGHYGVYSGNVRRDLLKYFAPTMDTPQPIRVTVQDKKIS